MGVIHTNCKGVILCGLFGIMGGGCKGIITTGGCKDVITSGGD
jgi:hypothetical protein